MINEIEKIAIEAGKNSPLNPEGKINIDHLMYLINESKYIIDKFEIKHGQEAISEIILSQRELYIEMAYDIFVSPNKFIHLAYFEFLEYIEASSPPIFTPDSRGSTFPSVESQIADNLVNSVFGSDDAQGETRVYGSHHDVFKSLLTFLLAKRKISSIGLLPDGWNKANEDIRLVNILFRDLEANLQAMGWKYLLEPAKFFVQSYSEALSKDSTLSAEEVKKRLSSLHLNKNKLHLLRQSIRQPIEIKYNQQSDDPRFFKLLDLFITIQCITEAMHHGHQPARTAEGTDTHHGDYYYEHQECKDVAKLKLVYNKNNHELTIHSSRGETQSNKKKQIENKKNR